MTTVDKYISGLPDDVRPIMERIRIMVHVLVPDAEETMSYGMPTITRDGRYLMYFAGWKKHVAIYPLPAGDAEFERDIAPYRAAKGTARFPLGKPIPYELIERLLALLIAQRS
jgi:uncharacterized protein YdhG (YjbR/CyaY superfamily)